MNIVDPFLPEYVEHQSNKDFYVTFVGQSECGMGGPMHGTLKISGYKTIDYALPCVIYSEATGELGYMSWRAENGGAVIDIHITDFNSIETFEVGFGALYFISITSDEVILKDQYQGKTIKITRNQKSV